MAMELFMYFNYFAYTNDSIDPRRTFCLSVLR